MEEAKTSAASETEETDKTETTPGELSEPASRDMAKDTANQQMEEEPGTVETQMQVTWMRPYQSRKQTIKWHKC